MKFTSTVSIESDRRQMMVRDGSRDSLFSSESLLIFEDEYDNDDEALCPTNVWACDDLVQQQQQKHVRKVRFADQDTVVYHDSEIDLGERLQNWYTGKDYNRFICQTSHYARLIRAMEKMSPDPFFWTRCLERIHKAFTANNENVFDLNNMNAKKKKSSMVVLMSNRIVIDERFVGMECRAVPCVFQSYRKRRQSLLNQVQFWQNTPLVDDPNQLSDMIRKVSENSSRVSVLYAHYIARVSARNIR